MINNDWYVAASEKWCECKYAIRGGGFKCGKLNCRIMLKYCYRCEDFEKKEEEEQK